MGTYYSIMLEDYKKDYEMDWKVYDTYEEAEMEAKNSAHESGAGATYYVVELIPRAKVFVPSDAMVETL